MLNDGVDQLSPSLLLMICFSEEFNSDRTHLYPGHQSTQLGGYVVLDLG